MSSTPTTPAACAGAMQRTSAAPRHAAAAELRLKRHASHDPSTAARRAKPCPATRTSAPPSAGPLLGASARTRCARWYAKVRTARRELVPISSHLDSNVPRRARARRRAREHAFLAAARRAGTDASPMRPRAADAVVPRPAPPPPPPPPPKPEPETARSVPPPSPPARGCAVHRARHAVHERRRAATHRVAVEHAQRHRPALRGGGRRAAAHEHTTRASRAHRRTRAKLAVQRACAAAARAKARATHLDERAAARRASARAHAVREHARVLEERAVTRVLLRILRELDADDARRVRRRDAAHLRRATPRRRRRARLKRHARYPSTAARRAKPCPATRTSAPPSAGPLLGASARTRCARWYSKCAPPGRELVPIGRSTATYPGARARGVAHASTPAARAAPAPTRRRCGTVPPTPSCRGRSTTAAAAAKARARDGEERAAAESAREGCTRCMPRPPRGTRRRRAATHRVAVEHAQRAAPRSAARARRSARTTSARASRAHRRTRAKLAVQRARAPPPRAARATHLDERAAARGP